MVFVAPFSGVPADFEHLGHMTSIGTLFAFVIVCAGVMVMRMTNPDAPRPYQDAAGAAGADPGHLVWNFAMMDSLGWSNWARLVVWLVIGQAIYFLYSRHHSHLRKSGHTTSR